MVEEWRERVFGETMDDPVKVAVEEAVKDFGAGEDFAIWAWYAKAWDAARHRYWQKMKKIEKIIFGR